MTCWVIIQIIIMFDWSWLDMQCGNAEKALYGLCKFSGQMLSHVIVGAWSVCAIQQNYKTFWTYISDRLFRKENVKDQ